MIFKIGLSAAQRKALEDAKLGPQPWKLMFAWHPIRMDDNVWLWLEYYEYRDVYKWHPWGITCDEYEVRSTLRGLPASGGTVDG